MSKITVLSQEIKTLYRTGFFHIFSSQVINKIIAFCSGVFVIRILSKVNYGIYSYANNIISIFLLLSGLGAVSGLLQYGSENRDNPQKIAAYSQFAWKIGVSANVFISILIVLYTVFFKNQITGSAIVLLLMCLYPIITYVYSQMEIGFRIHLQNKIYSLLSTINSLFILVFSIFGAIKYQIIGTVLFRYIAYILSIFIALILAKKYMYTSKPSLELTKDEKRAFFKLSFISSITNGISQMLYLLDVFVIGMIIPNAEIIASYKAATTIPFAMNFVPLAIITYVYPYFASHNKDREWVIGKYYQLLKRMILLNFFITAVMYIFAPLIIKTVFGTQYIDSIEPFRVLALGYFVAATFRIPSGNILVSLHRVTFNFYNSIISGAANVVLNLILIKKYGSIGAAYSTVIVYIISSLILTAYLQWIIRDSSRSLVV